MNMKFFRYLGISLALVAWRAPEALAGPLAPVALAAAAFLTTSLVGQALLATAVSVGLSLLASAIMKKPSNTKTTSHESTFFPTQINIKQAAAPRQILYGLTRVGGTIVFAETSNNNLWMNIIIVVATHEIQAFRQLLINDEVHYFPGFEPSPLPPGQYVLQEHPTSPYTPKGYQTTGGKTYGAGANPSLVFLQAYRGAPGQVADQSIIDSVNFPPGFNPDAWTSTDKLEGCAYIYLRLQHGPMGEQRAVFSDGLPNFTVVVNGHNKIYDPRTDTYGYTPNSALIVNDFLTNSAYGMGYSQSDVDLDVLAASANDCDQAVDHGTRILNRFATDGAFTTDLEPQEVLGRLLACMRGQAVYDGDKWRILSGTYRASSYTIYDTDLRAGPIITTMKSKRDRFNSIKGKYQNGDSNFIEYDFQPIVSAPFLAEDDGIHIWHDVIFPFTLWDENAQMLAKLELELSRRSLGVIFPGKLNLWNVHAGDTITWNSELLNIVQTFEVVNLEFVIENNTIGITLHLIENDPSFYNWTEADVVVPLPPEEGGGDLNPIVVQPPTNLTTTEILYETAPGAAVRSNMLVEWDASPDGLVTEYEVQYRLNGAETWISMPRVFALEIIIPDLAVGTYNVRVAAVNGFGNYSTFISTNGVISGDTVVPNDPTGFVVGTASASGWVTLSWDLATQERVRNTGWVEIRYQAVTSGGTWNAATVVTSVNGNNTSETVLAKIGTYFIKFKSASGIYSANAASGVLSTLYSVITGIEIVDTLPTTDLYNGRTVFLTTDGKWYRYVTGTGWVAIPTSFSDLTGTIDINDFPSTFSPVERGDTLPTSGNYEGRMFYLTTDNKLYRYDGTQWIVSVATTDLTGTLAATLFSTTVRPVEIVSTLPVSGNFQGRTVLLTTDNKIYRYTGTAWTAAVPTIDLTGQITETQISNLAISTPKIQALAVEAGNIAAGAITTDKLDANSVTAGKIAAGEISATHIASKTITAEKIAIGDTDNRASNGDFAQGNVNWGTYSGLTYTPGPDTHMSITAGNGYNGSGYHLAVASGATVADLTQNAYMFQAIPGEVFYLSAVAMAVGTPSQALNIRVRFFDLAGNAAGSPTNNVISFNSADTSYVLKEVVSSAIIVPAGVGALYGLVEITPAGTISSGSYRVGLIQCLRRNSGELVVDGAIQVNHMAANSVDTDQLVANSVIAGKIAASAVTTTTIAAKAVVADKMQMTDTTNRAENGDFALGDTAWGIWVAGTYTPGLTTNYSITSGSGYQGSPNKLVVGTGVTAAQLLKNTNRFPVTPGDVYLIQAAAAAISSPNQSLNIKIVFWDSSNNIVASTGGTLQWSSADGTSYVLKENASNTVVVPPTAVYGFTEISVTGTLSVGSYNVGYIRVTRRLAAELIVDGTITAQKIQAGSLTANVFAVGDFINRVENANFNLGNKSWGEWKNNSATVTMTIASPCVVTWTTHGLAVGTRVRFTTTNTLPTGIVAGTDYFVSSTGQPSTNEFRVSTSLANALAGINVNTSGTQSGTHTGRANDYYPSMPSANQIITAGNGYLGSAYHLLFNTGSLGTNIVSNVAKLSVIAGEIYSLSAVVQKQDSPNLDFKVKLAFFDANNLEVTGANNILTWDNVTALTTYDSKSVAKADVVVPSTAVYATIQAYLETGTLSGGTWRLGLVTVMRRNSGEMIVDGTITANHLAADSVTATKIDVANLEAISAHLGSIISGTITGATIRTADSTTRVEMAGTTNDLRVYISGTKVAQFGGTINTGLLEIVSSSASWYPITLENTSSTGGGGGTGGGVMTLQSVGGWALEIEQTAYTSGTTGVWCIVASNSGVDTVPEPDGLGGEALIAGSYASGGYAGYANRGTWSPFTGSHEGLLPPSQHPEQGDILIDGPVQAQSISDAITEVYLSSQPNEAGAIGIFVSKFTPLENTAPAALLTFNRVTKKNEPPVNWNAIRAQYNIAVINAIGEGEINVCGENGNISKGDLIVTSSIPGKGMKQSDNIVRSYTVAKARQDVTFNGNEIKRCACIYLCG